MTGPAISGWTLRYSYSGNQSNPWGWGGTWSESGENVTVTNASYNGNIAPGASAANIYSGCPITSVTFYARNTNTAAVTTIGTVTSTPYTVQWENVPVGSYWLTAVATDSPQGTVTTPPVQIYVANVDPP